MAGVSEWFTTLVDSQVALHASGRGFAWPAVEGQGGDLPVRRKLRLVASADDNSDGSRDISSKLQPEVRILTVRWYVDMKI